MWAEKEMRNYRRLAAAKDLQARLPAVAAEIQALEAAAEPATAPAGN